MLKNYITIAWRNLIRHKFFSLINILGFALGIAVFILIFQYALFEMSYDSFHKDGEHIYRVRVDSYHNGLLEFKSAYTVPALGVAASEQIPGVKDYFRLTPWAESHTIVYEENSNREPVANKEKNAIFADASFVTYFSLDFQFTLSDPLLTQPGRVIISESAAARYFGNDWNGTKNPIGKVLAVYNSNHHEETTFTVEGVFKDFPQNSHLQYDIIFSHSSLPNFLPKGIPEEQRLSLFENAWGPHAWYTYLVLNEQANPQEIEQKITALVESRNQAENTNEVFYLQPIRDIHLHSNLMNEPTENGNAIWVYAMLIVGGCILCLVWVNYINLSTARSVDRAQEVGLRKAVGAGRAQLVSQFLIEAVMVNLIAIFLAIAFAQIMTPYFSELTGTTNVFLQNGIQVWGIFGGIFLIGLLLTGFYPAVILTSFQPLRAVKGLALPDGRGIGLRKGLVVFQFAISLVLIISTAIIYQQIQHMHKGDLGIDTSQVLVIEGGNVLDQETSFLQTVENLRNEIITHPSIEGVSAVSQIPGSTEGLFRWVSRIGMTDQVGTKEIKEIGIDDAFFSLMGIELLAGRNFSPNSEQNLHKVIVNEAAMTLLDFSTLEEATGGRIGIQNHWGITEYEIIGVIKNYHQSSLQYSIEPLVFFYEITGGSYLVKLASLPNTSIHNTIGFIKTRWAEISPYNPFNYFFLDNHYDQQYKAAQRFGELIGLFSLIAILIACLGLFGLAAFAAERRTKEIGIRKVMGASVAGIVALLGKDFLKLVIIGFVIAIPIAWYAMNRWLEDFAYRIEIGPGVFLLAGLAAVLIALATVSWQSTRAALMNPVNSLRSE